VPVATPTPAERFATLLQWLGQAVAAMSGGDRLSYTLIALIIDRIRDINQRVARLAARIRAGRYAPRRGTTRRRPPAGRRYRQPNPLLKKFGWLLPLVPEAVGYRSQLEYLFRDAEVMALLAAAPASLRRPLRSLCWMLRVSPPPILAPPGAAPPQPAQAGGPEPPPWPPAPPPLPASPAAPTPTFASARGPPLPA
jgi:hypothetical protein